MNKQELEKENEELKNSVEWHKEQSDHYRKLWDLETKKKEFLEDQVEFYNTLIKLVKKTTRL